MHGSPNVSVPLSSTNRMRRLQGDIVLDFTKVVKIVDKPECIIFIRSCDNILVFQFKVRTCIMIYICPWPPKS